MEVTTAPCKNCGGDVFRDTKECPKCGASTWKGVLPVIVVIALLCAGALGISASKRYVSTFPHVTTVKPQ